MNRRSLNRIRIIFVKEVIDNIRDRRSVISALVMTLITPALLVVLIMIMGRTIFRDPVENNLFVPVVGAEHAPNLISFLEQNGIEILPGPTNPGEVVRSGKFDVVLIIPADYPELLQAAETAPVQLVVDSSRNTALFSAERLRAVIHAYDVQLGKLRLLARGIDPSITETLSIQNISVANPQSQGMIFLNLLPFLLLVTIFTSGMYVIIDTTAGERERGSLEPLLINPVARWEFVVGKYLAALPFVIFALVSTLIAFTAGFNLIPVEEYIGQSIAIDLSTVVTIFFICIPVVFFAAALQMLLATFTRSFKEAQTYVSLISFVPALPGAILTFLPQQTDLWKIATPTFGQQILINQVIRGENIRSVHILLSIGVTFLAALVLVALAIHLFQQERVLFSSK